MLPHKENLPLERKNISIEKDGVVSKKRKSTEMHNLLSWDDYFISVAFLSAMRSKDPATQVGACIVNQDKKICAIGYNGMPRGCNDNVLPWGKSNSNPLQNKYMFVCHAEMNAIMNKNSTDLRGCTIYVSLFPCNECSKLIIQAGIKEVVYFSDKHKEKNSTIASKKLLDMRGIPYRQIEPDECEFYLTLFNENYEVNGNSSPKQQIPLADKLQQLNLSPNSTSIINKTQDVKPECEKRKDYLSWEEYFMFIAVLSAARSKDPIDKEGACIVNKKNKIVAIGYNGMPRGCPDDEMPWTFNETDVLQCKSMFECHAPMNAVMNKNCASVENCTLYIVKFPCNECAKILIQSAIDEVVYYSLKQCPSVEAAKLLFDLAGIKYRKYGSNLIKCAVNFNKINE